MKRTDVIQFEKNYKNNLSVLHLELKAKTYQHSNYLSFYVKDPKLRHIHKATVKDRVLHHAIFRILYFIFDKSFIFDSYSCRLNKGTHRAVIRLREFARKVGKNNSRNCFVLKCDIKKYFDSINHDILIELIKRKTENKDTIWLINKVVESYSTSLKTGIPLGNITSQLFANVYLNELDQFIKHKLKVKYYVRYCDDFIILNSDKKYLVKLITEIENFIVNRLKLRLHERKLIIRNYRKGVDFLGYVSFPHHTILRTKTKRRIFRNIRYKLFCYKHGAISKESFEQTMQSYFGVLKHCNGYNLRKDIELWISGSLTVLLVSNKM